MTVRICTPSYIPCPSPCSPNRREKTTPRHTIRLPLSINKNKIRGSRVSSRKISRLNSSVSRLTAAAAAGNNNPPGSNARQCGCRGWLRPEKHVSQLHVWRFFVSGFSTAAFRLQLQQSSSSPHIYVHYNTASSERNSHVSIS